MLSRNLCCARSRRRDTKRAGTCPACGWLAQGNHPDFRLLQPDALAGDDDETAESGGKKTKPSQQITIDQVRALDDFLHVGTHRHGARVVLVNPAEAMNRSTANSLLKSLEEPIVSTLFILVSSEPERLLPTIRSRCQSITVPQPDRARGAEWLRQTGVGDVDHWLALAGGSPLLAVELGSSEERVLLDALMAELSRGNRLDPLSAATSLDRVVKAEKRPAPLKRTIEWSQKWIYDLALVCEGQPPRYFKSQTPTIEKLARMAGTVRVLAFNRKTLQYRMHCEQPLNSRLFLEEFFMSYVTMFQTA
ncbi:MAG: DNA polymerase III subunit delta' [Propionivibrio sp.]